MPHRGAGGEMYLHLYDHQVQICEMQRLLDGGARFGVPSTAEWTRRREAGENISPQAAASARPARASARHARAARAPLAARKQAKKPRAKKARAPAARKKVAKPPARGSGGAFLPRTNEVGKASRLCRGTTVGEATRFKRAGRHYGKCPACDRSDTVRSNGPAEWHCAPSRGGCNRHFVKQKGGRMPRAS